MAVENKVDVLSISHDGTNRYNGFRVFRYSADLKHSSICVLNNNNSAIKCCHHNKWAHPEKYAS